MTVDLHTLAKTQAGRRCFFLGNGPSLNRQDLSLLSSETVWAANRAYLLFDRISWRPSFYVIKDPKVIENSADVMNPLMRSLPETIFFYPDWVQDVAKIEKNHNVCFYKEVDRTETSHSQFSFNADEGVVSSSTVATIVLQLAVWMGFDLIILIGCDMSYQATGFVGQTEFRATEGSDPDHFDPRYLDGGRWQVPDVDRMLAHLAAAREACDAYGVTVLNATAGGQLEVFPRINYLTVFGKA
jgi:hypothetical protein